jgi:hypothetical protein
MICRQQAVGISSQASNAKLKLSEIVICYAYSQYFTFLFFDRHADT